MGNEIYTENQLLEMIQFYKQHHQKQENYLQHEDILHNILLQSDIGSTNTLLRTNKLATKTNENVNLWLNKLKNDYPLIIPKTTNYKEEYQNIYREYLRAKQLVDVLKLIKKDNEKGKYQCGFSELYIEYPDKEIDFNELTMLPEEIKNVMQNVDEPVINLTVDKIYKKNLYHFKINLEGLQGRKHGLIKYVILNENDYIMFLTALLYFEPNIEISDGDETPYLHNPYLNEPSEPTEEWKCIWKYWKKVLPKK